jgi:rubredoxin
MKTYKCTVCGYVYEYDQNDKTGNNGENIPFEDLPKSWQCPVCGADKSEFIELEE